MRFISRAVDRFCIKHKGFGIPKLMLIVVIISAVVTILMNTRVVLEFIVFLPQAVLRFELWRLVTWIFMPVGSIAGTGIFFTAIALYFYYFIGNTLEREWGTAKFTIYYLTGILLHVIYGFAVYFITGHIILLYPVYLNMSMFFAFALMFPDFTVRLFFIIPIKIKWLALLNAGFFTWSIVTELFLLNLVDAFFPLVAILNFLLICGDDLLTLISRSAGSVARRRSPQVVNFKKEAKRVKREMDNSPYRHKCAVCGATDTDSPELEFRYCSQCAGYHCFCSEHINNHIHFTQ